MMLRLAVWVVAALVHGGVLILLVLLEGSALVAAPALPMEIAMLDAGHEPAAAPVLEVAEEVAMPRAPAAEEPPAMAAAEPPPTASAERDTVVDAVAEPVAEAVDAFLVADVLEPLQPPPPSPPLPLPPPPTRPIAVVARSNPVRAARPTPREVGTGEALPGGAAAPAPTGPPAAPPPSWLGAVSAAMARHVVYPARLRAARIGGVVLLRFTMGRDGRVRARRVERSSGNADLDALALAVLLRAEPLPPPPDGVAGAVIELVVPVRYVLR